MTLWKRQNCKDGNLISGCQRPREGRGAQKNFMGWQKQSIVNTTCMYLSKFKELYTYKRMDSFFTLCKLYPNKYDS